jgi:hypothetical protein
MCLPENIILQSNIFYFLASIGASGALFSILAVYILDIIRNWKNLVKPWIPILINGTSAVILLVVSIVVPVIDYMAHLGGFLIGILSGLLICPNLYWTIGKDCNAVKSRMIIMGISSVFLLAFFLGGFIGFFQTTAPILLLK